MVKRAFEFKCHDCNESFEFVADHTAVCDGFVPPCPVCKGDDGVKRVWTFGQFTFKGGLPSNHGRDGVWR